MSFRFVGLAVVGAFAATIACSNDSDSDDGSGSGGAAAEDGGQGGTGGSGGTDSSGGNDGSGGSPPECAGLDAGASECLTCLAGNCCEPAAACAADSACADAFDVYQTCANTPGQTDVAGCFSAFSRTVRGDASNTEHDMLLTCIIGPCTVCGVQLF